MKIVENVNPASLTRSVDMGTAEQRQSVASILEHVREKGDEALRSYTQRFDGVHMDDFRISQAEVEEAYALVDDAVIRDLQEARDNIRLFHEQQRKTSWMTTSASGTVLGQLVHPIERVGAYVPGGTAAYPSSLLMSVIPAQVAGVPEIAVTTPPSGKGKAAAGVLVAADLLGIKEMYKLGGAQAIGGLAYGTETIPRVDKVIGPGNAFVALAKREVFGLVDIDMVAGPSDVLVLAEEGQNPLYIAADLLSQAEHGPDSAAVCVTPSLRLAEHVAAEVDRQLEQLPRQDMARQAIENNSAIYVTANMDEAIQVVNHIAPEHLEILAEDPWLWLGKVQHAGAIFLGEYSSEPIGDYFAGPSHVLPTYGTARYASSLHVDDFLKKSSIISYSPTDFSKNGEKVMRLARYEGLEAHARAIEVRFAQERDKKDGQSRSERYRRRGSDE